MKTLFLLPLLSAATLGFLATDSIAPQDPRPKQASTADSASTSLAGAVEFTPAYIDAHSINIHTYESWARTLASQVLQSASKSLAGMKEQAKKEGKPLEVKSVVVPATVEVGPEGASGCIWIRVNIGGVEILKHFPV